MHNDKINIAYLLYNERPNAPLIKYQVIDLLKSITQNKGINLTLISLWNPIIYYIHRKEISLIRNDLASHNIKLESYPIAIFPNRYFTSIYYMLRLLIAYLPILSMIIRLDRFDVVHSRSYLASYIAAISTSRKYKNIFDVRSLVPEENVTTNKWKFQSRVYNLWKKIEEFIINNSDATVVVSEEMKKNIYNAGGLYNKIYYIPLLGDADKFKYNENDRIYVRNKLKFDDRFVIAYAGSLGDNDELNNIRNYAEYVQQVIGIRNGIIFLFVVPKVEEFYEKIMLDYGIPKNMFRFVEGGENVSQYLSSADAGINIMKAGTDSSTRFGVKTVEYLLNGLPVMIRNLGGAIEVIGKMNAGIVLGKSNQFKLQLQSIMVSKYDKKKIAKQANVMFSLEIISDKCIELYQDLLAEKNQ